MIVDPLTSEFSYGSMHLGDNIFIGPKAYMRATHARIYIGSYVLFGPGVYILGGDHIYDRLGAYMFETRKDPDHVDADVVIENDVWIGAGVKITSGVTIHEGAIVATGAVVTRNVDAYSIHGGVPNRKLKDRFSPEDLARHRSLLTERR